MASVDWNSNQVFGGLVSQGERESEGDGGREGWREGERDEERA